MKARAQLVTPKPLQIDPQLTEALLQDVSGQDALPLLAFTLASLYEEYAANGTLTLADYNQFGRLHGVIGAAVEQALSAGAAAGALPKDKSSRLDLIRKAFIPHLARVNEAGQFVRHLAIRSEIPVEAHQLVDRFAEHRLLTKDFRSSGTEGYEVIEVAHEALLREWRDLNDMLQAERAFLAGKAYLEQSLREWHDAPDDQKTGLLLFGSRLARAEIWLKNRPGDLRTAEIAFIRASLLEAERQKKESRRQGFFAKSAAAGALVLLIAVGGISYRALLISKELAGECPAANEYATPAGKFVKEGTGWAEYQKETRFAIFKELRQDAKHVYISDSNRLGSEGRDFIVRIPKCGGAAEWSWSNPIAWSPFQELARQ